MVFSTFGVVQPSSITVDISHTPLPHSAHPFKPLIQWTVTTLAKGALLPISGLYCPPS